jgi:predicted membrane protein
MSKNDSTIQQRRATRSNGGEGQIAIILLVAFVVFFAVNSPHNAADREPATDASTFKSSAFFSGVDQQNRSSDFRSSEASAFMGDVKLDFRDAGMVGTEATINVSAVMGGVEIRVPRSWTVINHVTPIMGGVADHTRFGDGSKRLVIEGNVIMGGLEIKN